MPFEVRYFAIAPNSTTCRAFKRARCCSDHHGRDRLDMSAGVRPRSAEGESDRLIVFVQKPRVPARPSATAVGQERIQRLRELIVPEFSPAFDELKEKYAASEAVLEMDGSNFLDGGRATEFPFQVGGYRTKLAGTVTSEAVAFHETPSAPHMGGDWRADRCFGCTACARGRSKNSSVKGRRSCLRSYRGSARAPAGRWAARFIRSDQT